jgi:hypothetical protein
VLWPVSSTSKLENGFSSCLDSFDTLLGLLTATFLLDRPPSDTTHASLSKAVDDHSSAFTKLKADLADARHERYFDRRISGKMAKRSDAVVQSLTRLAQHLTGLRGGTTLQSELIEANQDVENDSDRTSSDASSDDGELDSLTAVRDLFMDFRDIIGPDLRDLAVSYMIDHEGMSLTPKSCSQHARMA